jgi:hypothetical protein
MKKGYLVVICIFLIASASIAQASQNLALSGIAAESSTEASTASAAIDGNTDGDWYHGSVTHTHYENQPWWMVSLLGTYYIYEINIWNRTDAVPERLSDFNVSVLDSGGNTVWQSNYADPPNPSLHISLPGNIRGDFVKVRLNGSNFLSLAEVQVYGNTSPRPYPLPAILPLLLWD